MCNPGGWHQVICLPCPRALPLYFADFCPISRSLSPWDSAGSRANSGSLPNKHYTDQNAGSQSLWHRCDDAWCYSLVGSAVPKMMCKKPWIFSFLYKAVPGALCLGGTGGERRRPTVRAAGGWHLTVWAWAWAGRLTTTNMPCITQRGWLHVVAVIFLRRWTWMEWG